MADYSEAIDGEIHRIMGVIAERLGLDELPLYNPGIKFFRVAWSLMKKMGAAGADLEDDTLEVLDDIALQTEPAPGQPVKEGTLFNYINTYEKKKAAGEPAPFFDKYFMMAFKQKAWRLRSRRNRHNFQQGTSITPGTSEEHHGISESLIPGGESAFDTAARADEKAHFEKLTKGIPAFLTEKRGDNPAMQLVWNLMSSDMRGEEHYGLGDIATELNVRGIPTVKGGRWTTGSVDNVRTMILGLVRLYYKEHGIDWNSIEASRSRSRHNRGRGRSRV